MKIGIKNNKLRQKEGEIVKCNMNYKGLFVKAFNLRNKMVVRT